MNKLGTLVIVGMGVAAVAAMPASAAQITFDFSIASGGGTTAGSGNSLTRSYSSGGVSLVARGLSLSGSGSSATFSAANLGWYSGAGFGVCNATEGGSGCASPYHQIDNYSYNSSYGSTYNNANTGQIDFVMFQFDPAAQISSIKLIAYGSESRNTDDADAVFYLGNTANPLNLVGKRTDQLAGLNLNAVGSQGIDRTVTSENNINFVSSGFSGSYNTLLIGAKIGDNNDGFKIKSVIIEYSPPSTQVPEPMSLALFGLGLVGLGAAARRRA